MKLENFVMAIEAIVDDRNVEREIVEEALKEAIIKAYRKQIDVSDALAEVVVEDEELRLYRLFEVVQEVEDDALQVQLDELPEDSTLQVGDFQRINYPINELGRAASLLAKQVLKQKIREAEKQAVYDEYIDKKDEMIFGEIESVEERFAVVNIGKALAVMPRAQQMSNEIYQEGQRLRVIISEVIKDTKGAQVIVSRADPNLVKRLFEKEVPEIYEGVVEIRAIAREAGERTKMAVHSNNPDIDPIGACIGPRGSRVQVVIEELKGEKIDIFEWSENTIELIRNVLSPADVIAVFPSQEKRGLVVVVDDKQLSLAIGRRGNVARLAVRLTKEKIDIKSVTEVEELGLDYMALMEEYQAQLELELAQAKAKQAQARLDAIAAKEAELQKELELEQEETLEEVLEEVLEETPEKTIVDETTVEELDEEEVVEVEPEVVEEETLEEEVVEEEAVEEKVETVEEQEPVIEKPKPKKTIRQRQEYVSKFEELADASRHQQSQQPRKRKRRSHEEELKRVNTAELLAELEYEIKPTYTEEELAEVDTHQLGDDWYDDIDYDDFDDYYED
jgi:N utilization substance protein A